MNFKIGDKVIFLPNSSEYAATFTFMIPLSNDKIYTIRGLDGHGSAGIYLEGIFNEVFMGFETSYSSHQFRKVDESFAEDATNAILKEFEKQLVYN